MIIDKHHRLTTWLPVKPFATNNGVWRENRGRSPPND